MAEGGNRVGALELFQGILNLDSGRLVWVESGCLFAGELSSSALIKKRELHDFNPYGYERIEAPY